MFPTRAQPKDNRLEGELVPRPLALRPPTTHRVHRVVSRYVLVGGSRLREQESALTSLDEPLGVLVLVAVSLHITVHSVSRSFAWLGSMLTRSGRAKCGKLTIACPAARFGRRSHNPSSTPPTVRFKSDTTCGS